MPAQVISAEEFKRQWAAKQSGESANGSKTVSTAKRGSGGKRPDLDNRYFRSKWEANFARYLNHCVNHKRQLQIAGCNLVPVRWEYEPEEFKLFRPDKAKSEYKTGARFYKPDFKVHFADGTFIWFEVKGWMDDESRTKLKRFERCYPDQKIAIIGPNTMKSLNGLYGMAIPGWESGQQPAKFCSG